MGSEVRAWGPVGSEVGAGAGGLRGRSRGRWARRSENRTQHSAWLPLEPLPNSEAVGGR